MYYRTNVLLQTLIERFANNTSLQDFFESLNNIYRDADNDPELREWFKNVDNLIRYVHTCSKKKKKERKKIKANLPQQIPT